MLGAGIATSALDEGERWASRSSRFILSEISPSSHWTGDLMGSDPLWTQAGNRRISVPVATRNAVSPLIGQSTAHQNTRTLGRRVPCSSAQTKYFEIQVNEICH